MKKKCTKCGEIKNESEFHKNRKKKSGLESGCKLCKSKYYWENKKHINNRNNKYYSDNSDLVCKRQKIHRENNPEKIAAASKKYREENKEYINKWHRQHYRDNSVEINKKHKTYRASHKEEIKNYRAKNKEKISSMQNKRDKERKRTDPIFRLTKIIRSRINIAIKKNYKSGSTLKLLDCTIEELKDYLESQFTKGMNWDNNTINGWHIDHIRPCASFDMSDPEQQKECFHWSNLQPLWAADNMKKGSNYL